MHSIHRWYNWYKWFLFGSQFAWGGMFSFQGLLTSPLKLSDGSFLQTSQLWELLVFHLLFLQVTDRLQWGYVVVCSKNKTHGGHKCQHTWICLSTPFWNQWCRNYKLIDCTNLAGCRPSSRPNYSTSYLNFCQVTTTEIWKKDVLPRNMESQLKHTFHISAVSWPIRK